MNNRYLNEKHLNENEIILLAFKEAGDKTDEFFKHIEKCQKCKSMFDEYKKYIYLLESNDKFKQVLTNCSNIVENKNRYKSLSYKFSLSLGLIVLFIGLSFLSFYIFYNSFMGWENNEKKVYEKDIAYDFFVFDDNYEGSDYELKFMYGQSYVYFYNFIDDKLFEFE